jgi:hypothetical protein
MRIHSELNANRKTPKISKPTLPKKKPWVGASWCMLHCLISWPEFIFIYLFFTIGYWQDIQLGDVLKVCTSSKVNYTGHFTAASWHIVSILLESKHWTLFLSWFCCNSHGSRACDSLQLKGWLGSDCQLWDHRWSFQLEARDGACKECRLWKLYNRKNCIQNMERLLCSESNENNEKGGNRMNRWLVFAKVWLFLVCNLSEDGGASGSPCLPVDSEALGSHNFYHI